MVMSRRSELFGKLEFECALGKATIGGAADVVGLDWEASNGVDLDVRKNGAGNRVGATFTRDVRADFFDNSSLEDVTYTCGWV